MPSPTSRSTACTLLALPAFVAGLVLAPVGASADTDPNGQANGHTNTNGNGNTNGAASPNGNANGPVTPGLRVHDGRIVDANGRDVVMRGVNHPHAWYRQERQSIDDIAALGADTVRVVLSSGDYWERIPAGEVSSIVGQCQDNGLICVLEVHDTTGYGDNDQAVPLDRAVDYWVDIQDVLHGEEDNVVINIGNEPHGNSNAQDWTHDTVEAVERMRAEGFEHALMVDAPNWGQDWSHTMRDNADAVFAADPHDNTIFSIHMYGVYEEADTVYSYLGDFVDAGLPLVVGEFGHEHSDSTPDEDAILAAAEEYGIGYLGWSWSGNSGGVEYLDMVYDFDSDHLTDWGERIFHGENGIAETADRPGC
ncbi:glycoside hydrolase family 5 protein [Lipingzhangella sp. LS1_29]|uniref:cellulase n=1 Tax=Lipingzhangella rawalii TaxID=2055835 RepID=A0ABU2H4A0_9ACTN|nr:glycoside hydrolase family 5 protein [Lipingzhangella rawalii]MDS1270132.1 glycoside hydrolase family 5 protein [Lipingzhangella rawalii]